MGSDPSLSVRDRPRFRFTIGRLMVATAMIAAVLGLLNANPYGAILIFYVVALAAVAWLPSRGRSRVASWGFYASAAWINLALPTFYVFLPYLHNVVWLLLSALICVPFAPGFGLAWVANHPERRGRIRSALVVVALVALPASMLATRWPFRLAFYLASPGLNRIADRVKAGGRVVPGEWAGIYRIWGATPIMAGGDLMLLVDADPRGRYGFIRDSSRPPVGTSGREGVDQGGRWSSFDED